ncbi:MAG TPA: UDP-N-acetylglucosamine 2-epimerase (non-hydrolyzing) [Blastocatellia bacterium]|nr:UDP-N-acetylglucosamine 2-epimerase (non-hydrolyzing) [Blastocatellia bacterium]
MLKVLSVVGARPNFMKIAPVVDEMRRRPGQFQSVLVHTGQHYDESMSDSFFHDLQIQRPDVNLEVGSASHTEQTARIMIALEPVILEHRPDWVVVVGDVNSTMAATLVAAKMLVPVAHVEAGLRSRDRTMPEEINRIVTDAIADLLLTPSPDANQNLLSEGVPAEKIRFVGNVMIDSLFGNVERARQSHVLESLGVRPGEFGVVTMHRPSNVDEPETLRGILDAFEVIQRRLTIVFPVHPRTRARMREFGLESHFADLPNIVLTEPLGYLDFLHLYSNSRLVLTDSGGVQEETTVLGIPCLTMRHNTERPITVTEGTNRVVGNDPEVIEREAFLALDTPRGTGSVPELWDGRTAARIVDAIQEADLTVARASR